MTSIHSFNPLQDLRWQTLLDSHPDATVFHSTEWLDALQRTYRYEPVVFTLSPPGAPLTNGIVFCRISSWLTGRRLVSLPFSDHCQPLTQNQEDLDTLLAALKSSLGNRLKYLELRPLNIETGVGHIRKSESYYFHRLDLQPTVEQLYSKFDKTSIQQRIRRAEREGLTFEEGRSEEIIKQFYRLLVMTRRRHQLPPPPEKWFLNLAACFGDKLTIRLASHNKQPVASTLTFQYKRKAMYKYGASDPAFHKLGSMPALIWMSIRAAKAGGCVEFDFGRSDQNNQGLVEFKDRWNAERTQLDYFRYAVQNTRTQSIGAPWGVELGKRLLAQMPEIALSTIGKVLYKHVG